MSNRAWRWVLAAVPLAAATAWGAALPAPDPPGQHNMLAVGEKALFLSHLPMFHPLDSAGVEYATEHRYQVILEVGLEKDGRDVTSLYTADRRSNPTERMYTVEPRERFVLPDRMKETVSRAGRPVMPRFTAKVYRGHLERGGNPVPRLDSVVVNVRNVVHLRQFHRADARRDTLSYILFGRGGELFAAHAISGPPDFDQVMSVTVRGPTFTDAELAKGVEVVVPGRANTPERRLQAGERVIGSLRLGGAQRPPSLQLTGGRELYFEEGELALPATFRPTAAEQRAGF